ncbi:MAG: hypothetical protein M3467_05665 [Actinomycetota bacterium]|nr:hypothetical protein [Actinomycetota bacterium]
MTGLQQVVAELHINCGQARRDGSWARQPTARYTCHRCGHTETVTGPDRGRAFAAHIRTTHPTNCPARNPEGAHTP